MSQTKGRRPAVQLPPVLDFLELGDLSGVIEAASALNDTLSELREGDSLPDVAGQRFRADRLGALAANIAVCRSRLERLGLARGGTCCSSSLADHRLFDALIKLAGAMDPLLTAITPMRADGRFDATADWVSRLPADAELNVRQAVAVLTQTRPLDSTGQRSPGMRVKTPSPNRPKQINARMLTRIQKDRDCHGWSLRQWAKFLGCSHTSVSKTQTWNDLQAQRHDDQASRKPDRRRRGTRR